MQLEPPVVALRGLDGVRPPPAGQVGDAGHLEPDPGGGRGALEAARQAPPAAKLGEGVFDLVEQGDRVEAAPPPRRRGP